VLAYFTAMLMLVTIPFKQVLVGTEVRIEQAGIPEMMPAEACYLR
jgi:hypothetical protein